MIATVINIVKSDATFATSSKWSDTIASNFNDTGGHSTAMFKV